MIGSVLHGQVRRRSRAFRLGGPALLIGGAALVGLPVIASAQGLGVTPPIDTPAVSQPETESGDGDTRRYSADLGVAMAPDYEGSDDYRPVPLWRARAQNLYGPTTFVELFGPRLTSNLVPHPNLRLGPMLQYIPKRGSVDNDRVDDLQNVDPAFLIGVTAGWDFLADPTRGLGVFTEARGDVANGHGLLITPGVRGRIQLAPALILAGSLSTTWASEAYQSDYFGVDGRDARRSDLDRHDADAGFKDVGVSASLTYRFGTNFEAGALARYARLVGDAADSPIVDDEGSANQLFGGLLVGLRF